MANTTRGIPYPDEYNDPADVPAALESLAVVVDTLVGAVDNKANNAATSAASANTAAAAAANTASTHTHNGSGSPNIAIAAVSGLGGALAGKSDTGHEHAQYSLTTHSHTSDELAAHTHTDYAATGHTHTQAESHNTPDTDTAPTALHHTLGFGANQAAAGNHIHSGYAVADHGHNGFAPTTHTHNDFSLTTHNHATLYAAISHSHDASNITSGTLAIGRIPTGTTSSTVALGNHSHASLTLSSIEVTSATADFPGVYNNSTTGLNSVGITTAGRLRRLGSTQHIKYDIATLSGELDESVDQSKRSDNITADPRDALTIAVTEFSPIDDGAYSNRRILGFIAEDVAAKFPIAVTRDEEGNPSGVLDTAIVASLVAIVKDQQARIESLEQALQNR